MHGIYYNIWITLDEDLYRKIQRIAEERNSSMNQVMVEFLKEHVKRLPVLESGRG